MGALACWASGDVIAVNPSLPPAGGIYMTPAGVQATYTGSTVQIVLSQLRLASFSSVSLSTDGNGNEFESFNATLTGLASINGSGNVAISGSGPVEGEAMGKFGQATGTFNTQMLQFDLSEATIFGPLLLRINPTLQSLGQTSISDVGGGNYDISSYFDLYTEISANGGATWKAADSSTHVVLVPEPAALSLLALASLLLMRRRLHGR